MVRITIDVGGMECPDSPLAPGIAPPARLRKLKFPFFKQNENVPTALLPQKTIYNLVFKSLNHFIQGTRLVIGRDGVQIREYQGSSR